MTTNLTAPPADTAAPAEEACVACGVGPLAPDDWTVEDFARAYPVGAEAMEWNCSPDGLGWETGRVCHPCVTYWGADR